MLNKAVEAIEEKIASLKDRTAMVIKDIDGYLSHPGAKTKLRPRIVQNKGYSSFSIIWQRLVYYNFTNRRAILKAIRKGRGYLVPKSRLFSHCRNCASWEKDYIWEKEREFARVRRKVALLSQGVSALKQCCALWPAVTPEQCDTPTPGTAVACMEPQEVVDTLPMVFMSLKDFTHREAAEVFSRLSGDVRTKLRPMIVSGNDDGTFTVEWVKHNGCGPETGQPMERQIPREGRYSIRRSRLLAHCRVCEEEEQEFIWEKELEFARVRKQVDLLTQAITALKQYAKEAD